MTSTRRKLSGHNNWLRYIGFIHTRNAPKATATRRQESSTNTMGLLNVFSRCLIAAYSLYGLATNWTLIEILFNNDQLKAHQQHSLMLHSVSRQLLQSKSSDPATNSPILF